MTADQTESHGIIVNGEEENVPSGISLFDLLRRQGIDPESTSGVAVAVNEEVVSQKDWKGVMLGEDDEVEIITAKQGG